MDNPSDNISRAIALIRQGQKEEARQILRTRLKANPGDETAWLWLAETAENDRQRILVLEQCLKLIPNSQVAQQGITRLRAILAASADKSSQPSDSSPASATIPASLQPLPPSPEQGPSVGTSGTEIPAPNQALILPKPSSEIPTKPTPQR